MLENFKLDAEITVSELRQEEVLDERLRAFHRLRVRRRNDVFAVLVGVDEWRTLAAYVQNLEEQVERHEREAVRQILEERRDSNFVVASDRVIADIDQEYRKLTGE